MAHLGQFGVWVPTPLEVGLVLTVWPQIFATFTAVALVASMWLVRAVVAVFRRICRR